MAPANREIKALVDTTSDLNLNQKNIIIHLLFRYLFPAIAATKAAGIVFKTYQGHYECVKTLNSFCALHKVQVSLISACIEMSLTLGSS